MCDYSLMGLPNRLAVNGEDLVTRRFSTGTIGLGLPAKPTGGVWRAFKAFLFDTPPVVVCVPPGARLLLQDIPVAIQDHCRVGPEEEVSFIQAGILENGYRDSVRFHNKEELLLQQLYPGQRVRILDLSPVEVSLESVEGQHQEPQSRFESVDR